MRYWCCQLKVEAETSVPVSQTVPVRCKRIRDCPDYDVASPQWPNYQAACCSARIGPKYHCQENYVEKDGGHTRRVVACVYPLTCKAGTHTLADAANKIIL